MSDDNNHDDPPITLDSSPEPRRRDTREDGPCEDAALVDRRQRAPKEAENAVLQARMIHKIVADYLQARKLDPIHHFILDSTYLQSLNRVAVAGLVEHPGHWRTKPVKLTGDSKHKPPSWEEVPDLTREMCFYVNTNWHRSGLHLAAYLLWRLNWIHPWLDGNGRTARAVAYLVLCLKAGRLLPGETPLPKRIDDNRGDYYKALDEADRASHSMKIDVSMMETMIANRLTEQLENHPDKAEVVGAAAAERRHTAIEHLSSPEELTARTQVRTAWIGVLGIVIGAVATVVVVLLKQDAPDNSQRCLPGSDLGPCYCENETQLGHSVCSDDGKKASCRCLPVQPSSPPPSTPPRTNPAALPSLPSGSNSP